MTVLLKQQPLIIATSMALFMLSACDTKAEEPVEQIVVRDPASAPVPATNTVPE